MTLGVMECYYSASRKQVIGLGQLDFMFSINIMSDISFMFLVLIKIYMVVVL
jgi:hypothetical protein